METAQPLPMDEGTSTAPSKSLVPEKLPLEIPTNSGTLDMPSPGSTESDTIRPGPPKFALVPPSEPFSGGFKPLQLWEGHVTEIGKNYFVAVISDRTNPALADEEVTLEVREITSDDIPLMVPGAVFYWSIGYADYPGRPRTRESRIRFRRLPAWTRRELNRAKKAARELATRFTAD